MNEEFTAFRIDQTLKREFKSRASKEGISIKDAMKEAVEMWLDKKQAQEEAAIKSGTGTIGRYKKNSEKFAADLEALNKK